MQGFESGQWKCPCCNPAENQYTFAHMILTLEVKERGTESAEEVRAVGRVPAVLYGPKEAAMPIAVDSLVLEKLWKEAGETTLVKLVGAGEDKETLIKDVQFHPVTGKVVHADFYVLEKGKKVELDIPLEFVGVAPAEKAGHIVSKALHEVKIEVAPADIPHHIEVDLESLVNVGDHIVASQIKLPASAELKIDGDEIVASVTEFVEEKEEAPAAPAAEGEAAPAAEGEKTE